MTDCPHDWEIVEMGGSLFDDDHNWAVRRCRLCGAESAEIGEPQS